MILHGYWRSSASWRVRIALHLKNIQVEQKSYHLRRGEQQSVKYLEINPQGLVPTLEFDDRTKLTQSLAIIEYLDEMVPNPPLLPASSIDRAYVRAFAGVIACDIHPVQNLKILQRLKHMAMGAEKVDEWAAQIISEGLAACERLVENAQHRFLFGATPGLADICLVPQLANARRFGVNLEFPRLLSAEAACLELPAFIDTAPHRQPDAE